MAEPRAKQPRSVWLVYLVAAACVVVAAALYWFVDTRLLGASRPYPAPPRLGAEHAALAARLDDEDIQERMEALREIRALGTSGALLAERVALELLAPVDEEGELAVDALAAMGPEIAPFLWPYLIGRDTLTRVRTAEVFHRMGPQGLDRLLALWEERPGFEWALWEAFRVCGPEAVSRLVERVGGEATISRRAATALAAMDGEARSAIPGLLKLLRSGSEAHRQAAASALLRIEGDESREAIAILRDAHHPAVGAVLEAVLELDSIPPEITAAAASLAVSNDAAISMLGCLAVCRSGEAPAGLIAAMEAWLRSGDVASQERALIVFVGAGLPASCVGRVRELAASGGDDGVTRLARLALASSGLEGIPQACTTMHDSQMSGLRLSWTRSWTGVTPQAVVLDAAYRRVARLLREDPTPLLDVESYEMWNAFIAELEARPEGATRTVGALYAASETLGRPIPEHAEGRLEGWKPAARDLDLKAALTTLNTDPTGLRGNAELADESVPKLGATEPSVRLAAALNLIAAGREEGVVEAVIELLSHPDPRVREVAGGVLAVAEEDSVPILVAMLDEAEGDHLVAIIRAIGKQRARCGCALGALEKLTHHGDGEVRYEAEQALWWIGLLADPATPQPYLADSGTGAVVARVWPLTPARLSEILRGGPAESRTQATDEVYSLDSLGGIPQECMNDALAYCLADWEGVSAYPVARALLQSPGDHTTAALLLAGAGEQRYWVALEYLDRHQFEGLEAAWEGLRSSNSTLRLGSARFLLDRGVMEDQARAWDVLMGLAKSRDPRVSSVASQVLSTHAAPPVPPHRSLAVNLLGEWLQKLRLRRP